MKRLIFVIFNLAFTVCSAQSFKSLEGEIVIDTVVSSEFSQKQLYSNTLNYIASSFKNSNTVVELKDMELGEIVFSPRLADYFEHKSSLGEIEKRELQVTFKCFVYVKDNKFKIVIKNIKKANSTLLKYGDTKTFKIDPLYLSKAKSSLLAEEHAALDIIKKFLMVLSEKLNIKSESDF